MDQNEKKRQAALAALDYIPEDAALGVGTHTFNSLIYVMSALALAFYPVIAAALDLSDRQAGFLIGASVHDVAQAIGGGFSFSEEAGEVATIVKLTRVALLAPIVALVALWLRRRKLASAAGPKQPRFGLPWFIIGFLVLVVVNSLVTLPAEMMSVTKQLATWLLLVAFT